MRPRSAGDDPRCEQREARKQQAVLGAIERVERRKTTEEARPALLFQPALFDQIKHRRAAGEQEQRVAENVDGDMKSKEPPTHRVLGPSHEARAKHEGECDRGDEGAQRVDAGAAPQNQVDAGRKQRPHRREEMDRFTGQTLASRLAKHT